MKYFTFLSATLLLGAPCEAEETTSLPIQRVVLYKHGVGYFEREGSVTDSANIALRFKLKEMSDVLKSLTVLDKGEGRIAAIAYDSQKPTSEILADFSFDLRSGDVQLAMLRQLRGARVAIEVAGRGKLTGSILGVDDRTTSTGTSLARSPTLSLFTDGGEIVAVDLFDLTSLEFTDAALAADLQRYLGTLRTAQRRDEKTVELVCEGEGARRVFASYAVEQPVWKASYRLVLRSGTQKPLLQGWAIVDNTSDEDWTDVDLSLIAGLPVAFRHDLYTPRNAFRPLLEINETATANLGALMDMDRGELEDRKTQDKSFAGAEKSKSLAPRRAAPKPGFPGAAPAPAEAAALSFEEALDSQSAESVTREIGDLLEYKIDHKVTIPRNRSAMIPIVKADVDGSRVAIYREAARAGNPLSAVRLVNSSGVALEGGPLTVLEGETYAGEAYVDALKPNELRYVPFAVELGIKAESQLDSRSERVHKVVFKNGVMESRNDYRETKVYAFTNNEKTARKIVIEHSRRNGYRLIEPKAPSEEEIGLFRFTLDLEAGATSKFQVVEALEQQSAFRVVDFDANSVIAFEGQGVLNDASKAFLRSVISKKAEIAELERKVSANSNESMSIAKDQERVRGNLRALRSSAEEKELRRTYLQQMAADETRLKELRGEIDALRAALSTKQSELDTLLAGFSLEYEVK